MSGHINMVSVSSDGMFPNPVGSRSHMELGRSTTKLPPAQYLISHLTVEGHSMIVESYAIVGHGSVP